MDTHFENACGVTPQTFASSHWDRGTLPYKSIKDFIPAIVNPDLRFVNCKFILTTVGKLYNQPMVNIFIDNLLRLRKERGESWAEVGEAAGVTAQAAHKWSKGGNINDEQLNKLAAHYGVSPSQLKYGVVALNPAEQVILDRFRAASKEEQQSIFHAVTHTIKVSKNKTTAGYTGVERRDKNKEH